MQFYVMTRTHVRQFTLVHVAKCQSTISWIMSSYFPMTGFKATVRASTEDNRYNCAPPMQMENIIRWKLSWNSVLNGLKSFITKTLICIAKLILHIIVLFLYGEVVFKKIISQVPYICTVSPPEAPCDIVCDHHTTARFYNKGSLAIGLGLHRLLKGSLRCPWIRRTDARR